MIGLAPIGLTLEAAEVSAFSVAFAFCYADATAVVRPTATPAVGPDTRARAEGWVEKITLSSGAVACGSEAAAVAYVTRLSGGSVTASAVATSAEVLAANGAGHISLAAEAAGAAHFSAMGAATVELAAEVAGAARAAFFGRIDARAAAAISGLIFRRIRIPIQRYARGEAKLSGLAWSMVWAYGRKAYCAAAAIGTTYHVGRSFAAATAAATADSQKVISGTQPAQSYGVADGEATSLLCGYGRLRAGASCDADAAVRVAGTLRFECFGYMESRAGTSTGSVVVFQPARGWADAEVAGRGTRTRVVRGAAAAASRWVGDGSIIQTATQAKAVGTRAVAAGAAVHTRTSTGGAAIVNAQVAADALWRPTGVIADAVASAVAAGAAVHTRTSTGGAAQAESLASADALWRSTAAEATESSVKAAFTAEATRVRFEHGIAAGEAGRVSAASWRANVAGGCEAVASGTGEGEVLVVAHGVARADGAMATGRVFRTRLTQAKAAQPVAVASGFNQINDLARAPINRSVFVEAADRGFVLEAEARLMAA